MKRATLKVQKRELGKRSFSRALRRQGFVPANIYGKNVANTFCSFDERDLRRIFKGPVNSNTVLQLESEDASLQSKQVILREAAKDPLTWRTVHVDFYEVADGQKLNVEIPLKFVGTPKGVKLSGGIFQVVRRQIEVRGSLNDLPESIDIDVSEMDIDDSLHIADLKLPAGLDVLDSEKFTVVSVTAPKEEVIETPAADATAALAEGEGAAAAPASGAPAAPADKPKKES